MRLGNKALRWIEIVPVLLYPIAVVSQQFRCHRGRAW